jgi:hypothetical protein
MRVELGSLLFALLAPLALAAAAPCPETSLVIAHSGAGRLDPSGPYEAKLDFHLAKAARVWAEADGLRGLAAEDRDSAPEVFLDDNYLGPLLVDFGSSWRSPEALRLPAGDHQLLVRSAQEGEGPALRWTALRVLGDAPCVPKVPPAVAPPSKASKASEPASAPCGSLIPRRDWPARLEGRSLTLSAASGAAVGSGPLVHLNQGDSWRALMKIPLGPDGQPMPLLVSFAEPAKDRVRFLVWVDHQAQGTVGALGYTPGVWESLTLSLCSGVLKMGFAQEPVLSFAFPRPGADFEVAARDLDLFLAPVHEPSPMERHAHAAL